VAERNVEAALGLWTRGRPAVAATRRFVARGATERKAVIRGRRTWRMTRSDEVLAERDREPTTEEPTSGGRLSGLRGRIGVPFSFRTFLLAVAFAVGGSALAGLIPFVPSTVATLAGVFVGGFALGLVRATRSYLEVATAGTGTAVVAAVSQYLLLSFVGEVGVPVALIGAGSGLLTAVVGHYFGRDLRAGLTRDL
jgi:energy-converting hydrogenase Eha subunit A